MAKTKGPAEQEERPESPRKRQAKLVQALLTKMEKQLTGDGAKATLGDYIKLVQLQKELEDGELREVRVTWVDQEETKGSDSGE
jgi:hypothetical protein